MKKINLITALLLAFVFVFTACEAIDNESGTSVSPSESGGAQTSVLPESEPEVSEPEVSEPEVSEPEVSEPEVSDEVSQPYREDVTMGIVVEGDAYTQAQLDEWVQKYIDEAKKTPSVYGDDCKYNVIFFPESGALCETHFADQYLTFEKEEEYKKLFHHTEAYNLAEMLEYYGISWEDYIGFYVGNEYDRMMCLGKHADKLGTPNVKDGIPPYASSPHLFNSGWAEEEFWKHEDFYLEGYEPGEFEDYYTYIPVEERGGLMRRAYIIDGSYIEKIGWEAFNEWLDKTEDKEQTIWNFIEEFGNIGDPYESAPYKYVCYGLTEETRELYYTVHPLNKEE